MTAKMAEKLRVRDWQKIFALTQTVLRGLMVKKQFTS